MRNYADDVRETASLLATARVAVYPVDARGLMSLPSTSAASRFTPVSSGPPMPGKGSQGSGNAHAPSMQEEAPERVRRRPIRNF